VNPVVVWLLCLAGVALYCLVGIGLRFIMLLTVGDDPQDRRRPRIALLRDMLGWPLFLLFILAVGFLEGRTLGDLARDYRASAVIKP
jgi:hypothetical protein